MTQPATLPRARGFTLVELLAVVAIILLVAVIATPALTSLAKSSARRGGIALTMAALDEARSIAIAQGGAVYVVFADGQAAIPDDYRCRSFALFRQVYLPENKNSGMPYHFEPLRTWTKLPDGVAFMPGGGLAAREATLFSGPRQKFFFRAGTAGTGSAGVELSLPFLKFNSVGAIESENGVPLTPQQARVRLFEGHITAEGEPVSANAARAAGEAVIEVSLFTGRAETREQADAS